MLKLRLYITIHCYRIWSLILSQRVKPRVRKHDKTILFLTAFFPDNAGYEWRVAKWAEVLSKEGYSVTISSALDRAEFDQLFEKNLPLFLIKFLKKRFRQVIDSKKYDQVIVRRELLLYNDYGNLFLDKLLLKIHPNAILDFDDDIAYTKREPKQITSFFAKRLHEHPAKFTSLLSHYKHFTVGSDYLKFYLLKNAPNTAETDILVLPTCVNYDIYQPKEYSTFDEIVVGWIGGNNNQFLLENIIPSLNILSEKYPIRLHVISGNPFLSEHANFPIENVQWSLAEEVELLKRITIGVMPLNDTREDRGKAGFKLIQYMGLGIVSIASGITVNNQIVSHGKDGFLVEPDGDWAKMLLEVISQKHRFHEIGAAAHEKIAASFSFNSNQKNYLSFLESRP